MIIEEKEVIHYAYFTSNEDFTKWQVTNNFTITSIVPITINVASENNIDFSTNTPVITGMSGAYDHAIFVTFYKK